MVEIPKCACGCGAALVRAGKTGPAPRYASTACRMRASRRRRSFHLEAADEALAPVPVAVRSVRPDNQVAQAIMDARAVGHSLRRLSREVRPEFGWRCERLGDAILKALSDTFPETER